MKSKQKIHETTASLFHYWDEMAVQDEIILRGERVVIPEVLRRVHAGHLLVASTRVCDVSGSWSSGQTCPHRYANISIIVRQVPKRPFSTVQQTYFASAVDNT